MKKKVMSLLLTAAMAVTMLAGCGNSDEGTADGNTAAAPEAAAEAEGTEAAASDESTDGYELALVIDVGTIDDKSFNQGSWEGIQRYAEENGIPCKYYKSAEATTDSFQETISLAIEGGAKTIVCPGFLFEEPIYNMQNQYPDVHFILVDGEPHDADYNYETADNTMPILYQEDEAGFLAGYAAVKDGYTKLGFMGGMALPAVIRYGYGFLAGANYAAEEMGISGVEVTYYYTGSFDATPEAQTMAASWYNAGTEVIFACGGSVGNSVMAAAEASNGKVIGVDVDQSSESATVITSAMKMLSNSVYDAVKSVYDGSFKGGETAVFNAANDGVGLPMETSQFTTFTQADYDAIFGQIVSGEITIDNDYEKEISDLTLPNITVTEVQ
ncbi:MAG: BMP family ABC transporter substrate-binding protein [Roseburia sp.]|nr:BMP family ABC transporter substrate-binding protein [Roseburia sp.]